MFFVSAIGTDIGKTYLVCQIIQKLIKSNFDIIAVKPIATGYDISNNHTGNKNNTSNFQHITPGVYRDTDSYQILFFLQKKYPNLRPEQITKYTAKSALSPDIAFQLENKPQPNLIDVKDFCLKIQNSLLYNQASQYTTPQNIAPQNITPQNIASQNITPQNIAPQNTTSQNIAPQNTTSQNIAPQNSFFFVEGIGGIMSPMSKEFLNLHLALVLDSTIILVTKYYLGSISHTISAVENIRNKTDKPILLIINDYLEDDNNIDNKNNINILSSQNIITEFQGSLNHHLQEKISQSWLIKDFLQNITTNLNMYQ